MRLPAPRLAHLALATQLVAASNAWAQPEIRGRWSATFPMNGIAVHMGLLRGPADSWRVVWWSGFEGNKIQSWTYRPGPFDPATSFLAKSVTNTPTNFYECGFSPLPDGRLVSIGGEIQYARDGSDRNEIFDPLDSTVTLATRLARGRHQPTTTVLPDGDVLVAGGTRYFYALPFGGRSPDQGSASGLQVHRDFKRLITHPIPVWGDSVEETMGSALRPAPMEQHSAVVDGVDNDRLVVFGGRDSTDTAGEHIYGTVWQLRRNSTDDFYEVIRTWDTVATTPDPSFGKPGPRYGHTAVETQGRHLLAFGGRDGSGAFAEVWDLDLSGHPLLPAPWKRWTTTPDPVHGTPSARWGHAAVLDATGNRVLVLGGRDAAGACADDAWQVTLSADHTWTKLTASGSPRWDHTAVLVNTAYPRVWVYGGRGASGALADIREFRLSDGTWRGPLALAAGSPVPPARTDHAGYYHVDGALMTIHGGQLANGDIDDTVWLIKAVAPFQESTSLIWVEDTTHVHGPGRRAGHTMTYDPERIDARVCERFDPNGSTGGLPGVMTSLPAAARRWLYFYPPMFVLPSGNLFYGLGNPTGVLNLTTNTWTPIGGAPAGGTAAVSVTYRPGKVMRCGGNFKQSLTEVIAFDALDQTSGWSTWNVGRIAQRILHRGTLLPTGDLLITGGVRALNDLAGQRVPQLWNDVSGWSDSTLLAPEPAYRDYHATAILLPDARVMTAGGAISPDLEKGCVYEPPYLFDENGQLAAQPVLVGAPATIGYGQSFLLTTADPADAAAAVSVCLVKPSVTTHDVNFEQRYVPLGFTLQGDVLSVTAPPSGAIAPPGDYLLFLVKNLTGLSGTRQVPSIARWVRVAHPDSVTAVGGRGAGAFGVALLPPRPNPTPGGALLRFRLTREAAVRLSVHDAGGRRIRTVVRGVRAPGEHAPSWDGRDAAGRPVASGIYVVRLEAEGRSVTRRLVIAR